MGEANEKTFQALREMKKKINNTIFVLLIYKFLSVFNHTVAFVKAQVVFLLTYESENISWSKKTFIFPRKSRRNSLMDIILFLFSKIFGRIIVIITIIL